MEIFYSTKFAKEYKKLPDNIKDIAEEKEEIFRSDPFDSRLRTHKLKGELADFYSFSVSYRWRIVFHFENSNKVVFDNIGTHEVYR
ncbi:MAG TPA: type II toxin-antitoxin system mRNA interferase toxin, RelE/StbE family [Candidatus Nanoarchaeia archaeon]